MPPPEHVEEIEFGCPSRKVGIVKFDVELDRVVIEHKCQAKGCKTGPNQVVFHLFDRETLELLDTRRFHDPAHHFSSHSNGSKPEGG